MIFETHAHYDDEAFDADRDEILKSMKENGIGYIVNIGASVEGAKKSVELAGKYDFIYAAAGFHPDDGKDAGDDDFAWLEKAVKSEKKVVAVGEIGLDYYWEKDETNRQAQKEMFKKQIEIACKADKPIVIHSREAAKDTYDVLFEKYYDNLRGVMHCFSYSYEEALRYIKKGFYLGIGGTVTFKNARKVVEVVEKIPLEFLVLETDSPYLAPVPFRGKRNDSTNLQYVAEKIALIKGVEKDEVIRQTEANALKLYGISAEV